MALTLSEILKKRYGERRGLALDPLTERNSIIMLSWYRDKYPLFLKDILKYAADETLKELATALLENVKKGAGYLERIVLGAGKALTKKELQDAEIIFEEVSQGVQLLPGLLMKDEQARGMMQHLFKNLDKEVSAMESATRIFAIRFKARRPPVPRGIGMVRTGLAGLGEIEMALPGRAGALGMAGLTALLGPFAPLAAMGVTGVRGILGSIRRARLARQTAGLGIGLSGLELGYGARGIRGLMEQYGAGSRMGGVFKGLGGVTADLLRKWEGGRVRAPVTSGLEGRILEQQVLIPSVEAGMFRFFNEGAFKARYTKKLMKLLEQGTKDRAIGIGGRIPWKSIFGWIGAIIVGIAGAVGLGMLSDLWDKSAAAEAKKRPSDIAEEQIEGVMKRAAKRGSPISKEQAKRFVVEKWKERGGYDPYGYGGITAAEPNWFKRQWGRAAGWLKYKWRTLPFTSERSRRFEGEEKLVPIMPESRVPGDIKDIDKAIATRQGEVMADQFIKKVIPKFEEATKSLGRAGAVAVSRDTPILTDIGDANVETIDKGEFGELN